MSDRLERRLARRRRLRRRRQAAIAVVILAVVGVVVGLTLPSGGGRRRSLRTSITRPVPPTPSARRPPGQPTSQTALQRLIRIGRPLFCGGNHGHDVALTFDDGPGPYTALALRILHRAHAKATFFLVGRNLARWQDLPRQELTLAALGDHTWTHADLVRLRRSAIDAEIARTQTAIAQDVHQPVRLFRPPYGAHNAAVDAEAHALGMLEVLWSVDSGDSKGANYLRIQRTVLRRVRPGSIVLMHENRGQTIRALKYYILPALHRIGLQPVSIPTLLTIDPPTVSQLRAGYNGCQPTQLRP